MNVRFFLYDQEHPVDEQSPEWTIAIPTTRFETAPPDPSCHSNPNVETVSYGDYFTAVRRFLLRDAGHNLISGLTDHLGHSLSPGAIEGVHITIQKHGAFYHPAKVEVALNHQMVDKKRVALVVNAAFSEQGRSGLGQEFNLLYHLNEIVSPSFIPRVYAMADDTPESGSNGSELMQISMFLGEWFNGFHEFHLQKSHTMAPVLRVWRPGRPLVLTPDQEKTLYAQVAEILTRYYNPLTFEQIFPWHHAAGDFVVRMEQNNPVLRLITVRGYLPLVGAVASNGEKPDHAAQTDLATQLEGLFRFFLHMGLRTRIDRLRGTGDLCWACETAVDGTTTGLMAGLAAKESLIDGSLPYRELLGFYLARLSFGELKEALEDIIESYPKASPEGHLMKRHRDDHAKTVFASINTLWDL